MIFSRSILVAAIFACVEASRRGNAVRTIESRDGTVTQTQFDNFQYFAQYSAASYCASNDEDSSGQISCVDNECPAVAAADAITVLGFDTGTATGADVFGFVSTDPSQSLIVVSFRGSDSVRNWIANVEINQVGTSICQSCEVHEGFNDAWQERQSAVVAAVNSAMAAYPSYRLVTTGHSLGGAVATLAGAYFRSVGINCDIYTYGSPRVGNNAFANYASSTSQGSTSRITHLNDPVPHLPPGGNIAWLTNYYHTTPEYWLSDGTATTDNYAISDIKVCTGTNNQGCAGSVNILDWDVTAHGYYFEMISSCDSTFAYR